MTDKERLEEIKNGYLEGHHRLFGIPWVSMPKEYLDWLIKRVEELEEDNVILKATRAGNEEHIDMLHKQNKRYREVLEEIARDRLPGASYKARQALEGEK